MIRDITTTDIQYITRQYSNTYVLLYTVVKRQQKKLVEKFSTFEVSATSCPRGKKYLESQQQCMYLLMVFTKHVQYYILFWIMHSWVCHPKKIDGTRFFSCLVYDTYTAPTVLSTYPKVNSLSTSSNIQAPIIITDLFFCAFPEKRYYFHFSAIPKQVHTYIPYHTNSTYKC